MWFSLVYHGLTLHAIHVQLLATSALNKIIMSCIVSYHPCTLARTATRPVAWSGSCCYNESMQSGSSHNSSGCGADAEYITRYDHVTPARRLHVYINPLWTQGGVEKQGPCPQSNVCPLLPPNEIFVESDWTSGMKIWWLIICWFYVKNCIMSCTRGLVQ